MAKQKKEKPWVYSNPEAAKADHARRSSGAAGTHQDKRLARQRTRQAAKFFALRDA